MKTISKVIIEPVFVEFIPDELEDNKIYISEKYSAVLHNCLCGCGSKVSTPINESGWILSKDSEGRISLTPSIGNYQLPCKSHYVITRNVANIL